MPSYSFDVTSTIEMPEVDNAVNQAQKEIGQRFDFKGSIAAIDLDQKANTLTLTAEDNFKLESVWDVLQTRLIKRNVPVKNMKRGDIEPAAGSTREAGDHAAARHPDRSRQGHRQAPEGTETERCRPRSRASRCASRRRRKTTCRTRCRRCAPRISESRCSLATTASPPEGHTVSLERALSKLGLASRSRGAGPDSPRARQRRRPHPHQPLDASRSRARRDRDRRRHATTRHRPADDRPAQASRLRHHSIRSGRPQDDLRPARRSAGTRHSSRPSRSGDERTADPDQRHAVRETG